MRSNFSPCSRHALCLGFGMSTDHANDSLRLTASSFLGNRTDVLGDPTPFAVNHALAEFASPLVWETECVPNGQSPALQ